MRPDDEVRLRHMLDAAEQARSFVRGRSREELDRDLMLTWALVKAVEIIGEAACQLSQETRSLIPDVPWEDIVGMRHRLVHAYFNIDPDILWKTVTEGLPPLIASLKGFLEGGGS